MSVRLINSNMVYKILEDAPELQKRVDSLPCLYTDESLDGKFVIHDNLKEIDLTEEEWNRTARLRSRSCLIQNKYKLHKGDRIKLNECTYDYSVKAKRKTGRYILAIVADMYEMLEYSGPKSICLLVM